MRRGGALDAVRPRLRLLTRPTAMRRAAFFDLDGTLIGANSAALWMRRERRMGRITRRQEAHAALYILAYRLGMVDMERAMRKALRTVVGIEEAALRRWTRAWFFDEVAPLALPGALRAIAEHRRRGHPLVLLTSASRYESEAACEFFGLDDFLCTTYETLGGVLTGGVAGPICYGEGKVAHAAGWAREAGVPLEGSFFYTDSVTDLPMLLAVGHPRVVDPDARLRWEALRRGWPILDWRR